MRRPGTGRRVHGPYQHGNKSRILIVTLSGGKRTTRYESFDTRAEAEAAIAGAQDVAQGVTVSMAMEAWLEMKRAKGLGANTVDTYRGMLERILGTAMKRPVRYLRHRGEELYLRAQVYPAGHARAGQSRAVDTHRNSLERAVEFGEWCVKRKFLRTNPFAEVEPVGQRRLGVDKTILTTDESRQLEAWCIEHAADPNVEFRDVVLTLAYLYLGTRASELVKRNVRDIDDDGTVLRIGKTKTAAGQRSFRLPALLRDMLADLTRGRAADEPIFLGDRGKRISRVVVWKHIRAICRAAGVTVVGPQGLRRTSSSIATEALESPLAVAAHLGHATGKAPAVTTRHYVSRDAAAAAGVEQRLRVLQGGRR